MANGQNVQTAFQQSKERAKKLRQQADELERKQFNAFARWVFDTMKKEDATAYEQWEQRYEAHLVAKAEERQAKKAERDAEKAEKEAAEKAASDTSDDTSEQASMQQPNQGYASYGSTSS